MKPERLPEYLAEIDDLKKRYTDIEIYAGLEVDYVPGQINPDQFATQLDYTIGSVHFVDQFENGQRWEIDGSHQLFLDGLNQIFNNDIRAVIDRYFELTRAMATHHTPDVIGHLDKIKIQNIGNKFFSEADDWYDQMVEQTLLAIRQSGSLIEVNTRGIYQKKTDDTYPDARTLASIHRLGIPITVNSDAHHSRDLINCFGDTFARLQKIGFTELHVLSEGVWKPFPFDASGLKIS